MPFLYASLALSNFHLFLSRGHLRFAHYTTDILSCSEKSVLCYLLTFHAAFYAKFNRICVFLYFMISNQMISKIFFYYFQWIFFKSISFFYVFRLLSIIFYRIKYYFQTMFYIKRNVFVIKQLGKFWGKIFYYRTSQRLLNVLSVQGEEI